MIGKPQALTCEDIRMSEDYFSNKKGRRYGLSTLLHLQFGQRFILIIKLHVNIACPAQATRRWRFPFLGRFPLQTSEAALFLPWKASSAPLPSGKRFSVSPNTTSDLSLGQRPPPASLFSPSSADTWYGVGVNILVSRAFAESSGRGAEHQVNTAFFIQSCEGTG